MFCRKIDYLDYMSTQDSDFELDASSHGNSVIKAMTYSGKNWSPSQYNTKFEPVWISYNLLQDKNKGYKAAINDIKFDVLGADSVTSEYTFSEITSQENIPIGDGLQFVKDVVYLDVGAVTVMTGLNITNVRIVIIPQPNQQLVVFNMDVRVCYYPQGKWNNFT